MTRFHNDTIPIKIHTADGDKCLNDISTLDRVFTSSGERIPVRGVIDLAQEETYKVTFSDQRVSYFRASERIFISGTTMTVKDAYTHILGRGGFLFDMKFYPNRAMVYNPPPEIVEPLVPDPYTAGAFFMYGDYYMPELNLPMRRSYAVPFIINKKHIAGSGFRPGHLLFHYMGDIEERRIRWWEFFEDLRGDFTETGQCQIPTKYSRGSVFERWEFVRGAFDTGFTFIPNAVIIHNPYEYRLLSLQKILWGLGILSQVRYSPINTFPGDYYSLQVNIPPDRIIDFLYDVKNREKILRNFKRNDRNRSINTTIHNIEPADIGYTRGLILGTRPDIVYMEDNFIPRLSVIGDARNNQPGSHAQVTLNFRDRELVENVRFGPDVNRDGGSGPLHITSYDEIW